MRLSRLQFSRTNNGWTAGWLRLWLLVFKCYYNNLYFRTSQKDKSLTPAVQPLDDDYATTSGSAQSVKHKPRATSDVENADSASGDPTIELAFNIPVPGM